MIWFLFGLMLLAATLSVAWPLYRRQRRLSLPLVTAVGTVLVVSALVYARIGTPVAPEASAGIDSLAARVEENPDDADGWKMLAYSYVRAEQYADAERAFQRAVDLESGSDAQTLADLGESIMLTEGGRLPERAAHLFDNAIAIQPDNPKALFYGGIAAIERGDRALAADRWDALLALSPPPEIQDVLRQRVAEWRGEEAPQSAPSQDGQETVVTVNVRLGDPAAAAVAQDATVFIIARDPERPSPPIAAARRQVRELPASVELGDADAMIPGRSLSGFERLEIVARVSVSGQPAAQPGDWYGEQVILPADTPSVDIVIEQQVQ